MTQKTLLLIDEQEIFCLGVRSLLAGTEFSVISDFRHCENLSGTLALLNPDVVIVGLSYYRKESSLKIIEKLREMNKRLPIIVALPTENPSVIREAVLCGAVHYFLKNAPAFQLLQVLRDASRGKYEESPKLWTKVSRFHDLHKHRVEEDITEREQEVLHQVSLGFSNKDIAGVLGISAETVKEHVGNIIRKLKVDNRTQAAVLAVKMFPPEF